MSYEFYKMLHITGIVLLFSGLTALLTMKATGVPLEGPSRKFAFLSHGLGLFLILLAGFGMMARLGMMGAMPNWIYVKIAIWLYFGAAIALVKRKGQLGWKLYIPLILVLMLAAYVALTKPF
ncbi:MAG: hypothetical protein ACXVAX_08185 [Pseudobdellovibrio sp.]